MRDEKMSVIIFDVGHKENCEINFRDIYLKKSRAEDIFAYEEHESASANEQLPKPGIEPGTFRSSV